jgi:K+-transporting ATPase A subunit
MHGCCSALPGDPAAAGQTAGDLHHPCDGCRLAFATRIEAAVLPPLCIRRDEDMGWLKYALGVLLFNALGLFAVYALQRLQLWLPLNPQAMANVSPDSAFNTAVSFVTNTNWQGHTGANPRWAT